MSREAFVRDAVDRLVAEMRQDVETRLQAFASALLQGLEHDDGANRVELERAAVDIARAAARGGTRARQDLIAHVVGAIRRLDEASTLHGILEALADGAASETARAAVLVVDGQAVRSYRHHGFGTTDAPADVPLDDSPLIAGVVALRKTATIRATPETHDARPPAFMRVPAGRIGLLVPLVVNQQVVAIVYAEGADRQAGDTGEPVWTEQVEVVVRHASARLEGVTSLRTVEVLSGSS